MSFTDANVGRGSSGDRLYIEGYGPEGFQIGPQLYRGAVMMVSSAVTPWRAETLAALTEAEFDPVFSAEPAVEIMLLGCGVKNHLPPRAVRNRFKSAGIALEPMETGAACRTYNVLLLEDRIVAAALFPLGHSE
jgi:uncharacterized protein